MLRHITGRFSAIKYCLIVPAVLCCIMACSAGSASASTDTAKVERDTATYQLPLPTIPATLTTPEDRAAYLSRHYWDNMDWNDTLLLRSERFMGECMATYGTILAITPADKAVPAVSGMVSAAATSEAAIAAINDYAYDYYYYPDSPQYDPEIYLLFINALSAQPSIDMASLARLGEYRQQILKNRVGHIATDFKFVGTDGKSHSMLATRKDAKLRFLVLYDPDCTVCEEAVEIMSDSPSFAQAQADGEVAVIAINAFGQEEGGAAEVKDRFPAEWTVGYSPDGDIDANEEYVIRATPAIYILDSEGRILEKDLSINRLSQVVSAQ